MTREELVKNLTDFESQMSDDKLSARTAMEFLSDTYTDEERLEITAECISIIKNLLNETTNREKIGMLQFQLETIQNAKEGIEASIAKGEPAVQERVSEMTEEELMRAILNTGLDNIPHDMPREEIIEALTSKTTDSKRGLAAMNSLWAGQWTDEQRLEMVEECYSILLDKALNEEFAEDHEVLARILVTVNQNRVDLRRMIAKQNEVYDKILNDFEADEMNQA